MESTDEKNLKNNNTAPRKRGRPPGGSKIQDVPTIEELEKKVRTALEDQGTYSASLGFAIRMCAANYYAVLKTQRSIEKRQKVMYNILTREGSNAYKLYPDIEHLPALTRALKESLKSLGLTLDTLEMTDSDPLEELSNKVNVLRNG